MLWYHYCVKRLLKKQKQKYPLMQDADIHKYLAQSFFGPSHILDHNDSLKYLIKETEEAKKSINNETKILEYIGNNHYRVHLKPYILGNYNIHLLNIAFVNSSLLSHGAKDQRKYKRYLVRFNLATTDIYSVPHHSKIYKENYDPHYRVIHKKYLYLIGGKI